MEKDGPEQCRERVGAPRHQAADDPGERVAAAGDSEARSAASVGPGAAIRRDDMACHAFDKDDCLMELRGAQAAADGIALDLRFIAIQ